MHVNEFINTKNGVDGSVQNIHVVAKSPKTKKIISKQKVTLVYPHPLKKNKI